MVENKEYKICKDACANSPNCHCPENHVFHQEVAQTKEFIRRYFFQKGWDECIKESDVSSTKSEANIIIPDQEIIEELDKRYDNKDWSINEAIELAYLWGVKYGEQNG